MKRLQRGSASSRLRPNSFWRRGLPPWACENLCRRQVLARWGFYRHFASRDDLIAEAIRSAFDSLVAILELEIADKIPAKQLERIISIYLGQSKKTNQAAAPYLCPLAQLGAEMKHSAPVIQAAGFEGYGRLTKLIATCLPPSKAEEKAKLMVNTLVGAVTLASLAPDEKNCCRNPDSGEGVRLQLRRPSRSSQGHTRHVR